MTHTPGPWHLQRIGEALYVESNESYMRVIADMQRAECVSVNERAMVEANAEFIVRACNSHDALLAACKWAFSMLCSHPSTGNSTDFNELREDLHAAIAAAEGKG